MCGIVGIAGKLPRDKLYAAISRMNASLSHRGPDDQGSWVGEHFAFAMRRLSIIDLAGGHQPMWNEAAGLGIVYNGEVYNYRSLRRELERCGVCFQTSCDTEVVLQTIALKGTQAVHDWNGMFAVAVWDKSKQKLLLIRDRLGIKPLYYFYDGTMLIFASEIKALLASGLFHPELNQQALWDYLTFRYVPSPETIWDRIYKLPPASVLEWSLNGSPHIYPYWDSDVLTPAKNDDWQRAAKQFEDLFLDSVEQRLLAADVPVGVLLSGGLDSSSVAAAAVELGHKRFHTFSVGFSEGGDYSELGYARQVAEHLGAEHHEVVVNQSGFMEMLPEVVRAADEPLADLAAVPLLAVSRLARQWVKVVLSGEGGDEVLAGYDFGRFVHSYNLIKQLQTLPPSALTAMSRFLTPFSARYADLLSRIATIPLSQWNVSHKNHMTRVWTQAEKLALWPSFVGTDSDRILSAMYAAAGSEDPLDQILYVYQKSWLVDDLLMKADKMSMATSLELRVPLLDYRLVEWANHQQRSLKVARTRPWHYATKYVLRRFAEKRLPREILARPKRGFPVPACEWLKQEKMVRWALHYLMGRDSRLKAIFLPSQMENQVSSAAAGNFQAAHKTWLLIVLEIWLREYDVDTEALSAASSCEASAPPSDKFLSVA
jgi:asparagine synthase (glutamine-hydrolysing)